MKYKVVIEPDGSWETTVVNPQQHRCNDIVNVIGSFGEIKSISDKKDDVPVTTTTHVRG
jgi:hypothetical protein